MIADPHGDLDPQVGTAIGVDKAEAGELADLISLVSGTDAVRRSLRTVSRRPDKPIAFSDAVRQEAASMVVGYWTRRVALSGIVNRSRNRRHSELQAI